MKCIIIACRLCDDKNVDFFKSIDTFSLFQKTVARNISYCDEYVFCIESGDAEKVQIQMIPFQGVKYRTVEVNNVTDINAILNNINDSCQFSDDFMMILPSDIADTDRYRELVIEVKKLLKDNETVAVKSNNSDVNEILLGYNMLMSSLLRKTVSNVCLNLDSIKVCNSTLGFSYNHEYRCIASDEYSIIKLSPAFKDYLWGGTRLRDIYGKKCDYDIVAESWELSAHPDGQSIISGGKYDGITFGEYLNIVGSGVLGLKSQSLSEFPLLIKFIDAKGNLSVQVHPDDEYALSVENQYGKNEMWYILDCEPDSSLYVGFNKNVSKEEVAQRIKNNTILEVLNEVKTHPGDVFFIPAGTVHAIGAGNLICEIQQSSNCTYRLYDYDRRDKYGNPRELHLDKALDVLNYEKYKPFISDNDIDSTGMVLSSCKYFKSVAYDVFGEISVPLDSVKFLSIVCVKGSGKVVLNGEETDIYLGESIFVPAQNRALKISGELSIVVSHI